MSDDNTKRHHTAGHRLSDARAVHQIFTETAWRITGTGADISLEDALRRMRLVGYWLQAAADQMDSDGATRRGLADVEGFWARRAAGDRGGDGA